MTVSVASRPDPSTGEPWWQPGEAAYLWVPPGRVGSHGDTVAEVAEMMRRPLDPHQLRAVDAINSYGPGGRWLTLESCVVGPRQTTGKTSAIVLPSVCADLLTRRRGDPARCIWTSHRMKTTLDTFRDLKVIIEGSAEFSRRVARVDEKDGAEAVWFTNGSWLEFSARSEGAGRGLAAEVVVADEALYFTEGMAGDLLPAMASIRNPRVIYASSAPKAKSLHLHNLMKRGRSGADPSLVYVEYRAPGSLASLQCALPSCTHDRGVAGCRLDDEGLLRFGNPGLASGRIGMPVLVALRGALVPLEYAREMLGYEEPLEAGSTPITVAAWSGRTDPGSGIVEGGPRWLSVDVTPERSASAIGGAGRRADGGGHLALVDHRPGTAWVVDRVVELRSRHRVPCVVIDRASPASGFVPDLLERGLRVRSSENPHGDLVLLGASEMGQACGKAQDAIAGEVPWVWHRGDPALAVAVEGATSRDVGDGGWAFARKRSDVDISPLVAVVEALWGLVTVPAEEPMPLVAWR